MLLSPGHSPRHLSTPSQTPSSATQNPNPNSTPSKSTLTGTNTPSSTSSRKNSNTVLDEDTYVDAIEKIIERDFFPDIPKLRNRLDWLEAVRTGDPVQIRDAQLKIIERRRAAHGNQTSTRVSQTPLSAFSRNPSSTPFYDPNSKTPLTSNYDIPSSSNNEIDEGGELGDDLSLDQFFRRYTSEDNDSFAKILEKVNRKRKERYGYLLEGENCNEIEDNEAKREKVITDGYGTSDQPLATLEGWKYTAKNLLMYHPADNGEAPLTESERANRLNALTKEISKPNTRFHGKMLDSESSKVKLDDGSLAVLYTPVPGATPIPFSDRNSDKTRKYDLDDLKKTPDRFYVESGKKAENGYSFVKTPSPAPGLDDSPFITWGEIDGTPLRLDSEDTPFDIGGSGNGPHFKIPLPPSRDEKAHSLSRDAARKIRERSKMFSRPPLPSPVRGGGGGGGSGGGGSASPRILSPAAQKFVRNKIGKSSHTLDESLRASYRGNSPGLNTPKSGRSMSRLSLRSPSVKEGSNPPW